jgi:hypothetical protein
VTPGQVIAAVELYVPDYAQPLVASLRARDARLRDRTLDPDADVAHFRVRREVIDTVERRGGASHQSRIEHFAVAALLNVDGSLSAAETCAEWTLREAAKLNASVEWSVWLP